MSVQLERHGDVALLRLDRPEKLNAMTHEMGDALAAHVAALNADARVRAIVLAGAGRAFSAGGDLDFLERNAAAHPVSNEAEMAAFYRKFLAVSRAEVPVVAALHGRATGAGLCLALGCDLRVAAEGAILSVNFTRLGLTPGMGGTWSLPRLVGPAIAAELLYTGREVGAHEALKLGLVNRVATEGAHEAEALALAAAIAQNGPEAVRATKRLLAASAGRDLAGQLEAEARAQAVAFAGRELAEGLAAIRARRKK